MDMFSSARVNRKMDIYGSLIFVKFGYYVEVSSTEIVIETVGILRLCTTVEVS